MIHLKQNPVGIDANIQRCQQHLYDGLQRLWGSGLRHESYGRAYRNRRDNGYFAEVYTAYGEYKDAYWDDNVDIVSFFGLSSSYKNAVHNKALVHLVVFCNLATCMPQVRHRADEEARSAVLSLFGKAQYGLHFQGIDMGIDAVLAEYRGSISSPALRAVDMHPVHAFRVNFLTNFNPQNILTTL